MDSPTAPDPTNNILIFFLLAFGGRQPIILFAACESYSAVGN
jgi:hypothetical protein